MRAFMLRLCVCFILALCITLMRSFLIEIQSQSAHQNRAKVHKNSVIMSFIFIFFMKKNLKKGLTKRFFYVTLYLLKVRDKQQMNNKMKNIKIANWTSYKQEQQKLYMQAEINRHKKQIQYCEWIIAASVGASIALGFVLVHQIFFLG